MGLCMSDYQGPVWAVVTVIGDVWCCILTGDDTKGFCKVCKVAMLGEVARRHYHQPPKPPWSMVKLEGLHVENSDFCTIVDDQLFWLLSGIVDRNDFT